ncbi:uncharacterized [Tachysurus ichikawai]
MEDFSLTRNSFSALSPVDNRHGGSPGSSNHLIGHDWRDEYRYIWHPNQTAFPPHAQGRDGLGILYDIFINLFGASAPFPFSYPALSEETEHDAVSLGPISGPALRHAIDRS